MTINIAVVLCSHIVLELILQSAAACCCIRDTGDDKCRAEGQLQLGLSTLRLNIRRHA